MINQFIRKRNTNTDLPFSKNFARIEVQDSRKTFKFTKREVIQGDRTITTEAGNFLNTESGDRLITG